MLSQGKAQDRPGSAQETERERLPKMQRNRIEVAGIFLSDVHRSEVAPICRAEKKDWMETQNAVLDQVCELQEQYNAPVFIVGDLFDRWNASAWLINNTLVHLPKRCYGIPGNHDLPNHLYTESFRSAYWTLVEAGKLINIRPSEFQTTVDHLLISAFTCGFPVMPPKDRHGLCLNIALVHDYIWTEKTGHPNAPPANRYGKWMKKLEGYDVAVFGDNHRGFLIAKEGKCTVLNCGTLMRRKSDEISYTPSVGLLESNGKMHRHYLDVSKDQFSDLGREVAALESTLSVDLSGFIEEMTEVRGRGASWKETVKLWIEKNNLSKEVKNIIIRAVEEV